MFSEIDLDEISSSTISSETCSGTEASGSSSPPKSGRGRYTLSSFTGKHKIAKETHKTEIIYYVFELQTVEVLKTKL